MSISNKKHLKKDRDLFGQKFSLLFHYKFDGIFILCQKLKNNTNVSVIFIDSVLVKVNKMDSIGQLHVSEI